MSALTSKVSVVVPTHKSGRTLSLCLRSVRNQTYKNFEIIVVDDFSSDDTVQIAEELGARVLQCNSNPAEARNLGVTSSTGTYCLFLDSDQMLTPSVIEECVEKCTKLRVGMIRIPEVFVGGGFWSTCSAVWKNNYERIEFVYGGRRNLMHGEPRFFVKKRLEEVGMFNVSLLWGEDYDLYERLKRSNVREAHCSSVLYHSESVTLRQLFLKNIRYGETVPIFIRKTNKNIFPQMLRHALLTFIQVLKDRQTPSIVVGCAFLLWLKLCSTGIGVLKRN